MSRDMSENTRITKNDISTIYNLPLVDLIYKAQGILRQNFKSTDLQMSTLCSIKTGGCPEDCGYCAQSGHYQKKTGVKREPLMSLEEVSKQCKAAKENGADRFCIAAAWRKPPEKEFPLVLEMIREIKKIGLEACATLGNLNKHEAQKLKEAGLDLLQS